MEANLGYMKPCLRDMDKSQKQRQAAGLLKPVRSPPLWKALSTAIFLI